MGNIFNDDFRDFIKSLNANNVDYLLVGGYAVILHGYRRTTGDLDVWVNTTISNLQKLRSAFLEFGLPNTDLTEKNFLGNNSIDVFSYGRPPVSIDVMKAVKGLNFEEAFKVSEIFIENGLEIRYKDLDDIEKLGG